MPFFDLYPTPIKEILINTVFVKYPEFSKKYSTADVVSPEDEQEILTMVLFLAEDTIYTDQTVKQFELNNRSYRQALKFKEEYSKNYYQILDKNVNTWFDEVYKDKIPSHKMGSFIKLITHKLKVKNPPDEMSITSKKPLLFDAFLSGATGFATVKKAFDNYSEFIGDTTFSKKTRNYFIAVAREHLIYFIEKNHFTRLYDLYKNDPRNMEILIKVVLLIQNKDWIEKFANLLPFDKNIIVNSVETRNFALIEKMIENEEHLLKLNQIINNTIGGVVESGSLNQKEFTAFIHQLVKHPQIIKKLNKECIKNILTYLSTWVLKEEFDTILFGSIPDPISLDFIKDMYVACTGKQQSRLFWFIHNAYQSAILYGLEEQRDYLSQVIKELNAIDKIESGKSSIYSIKTELSAAAEQDTRIPLSDKLFAHVQNDHEASGTELEGGQITTNSKYLISVVNRIKANPDSFDLALPQTLIESIESTHLNTLFAELQVWGNKIDTLSSLSKKQQDPLQINALANEMIDSLFDKQSLTIPGGYAGSPGHAMIYEITLEGNDIVLKIFNSGDGIENHRKEQSPQAERYNPVLAYRFKGDGSPQKKLFLAKEMLNTLITPNVEPIWDQYKRYKAKDVYESIADLAQHYAGQEVEIPEFSGLLIKPQRSGICSWKVMMTLLRRQFHQVSPDKKNYTLFKLYFKLISLFEYSSDVATFTFAQHRQAVYALENIARLCQKSLNKKVISEEEFNDISKNLKQVRQRLEARKQVLQTELRQRTLVVPLVEARLNTIDLSKFSAPSLISEAVIPKSVAIDMPDCQGVSSLETLNKLSDYLDKNKTHISALQITEVIESHLEQFCNLKENQFEALSITDIESLLKKIGNILNEYNVAIAKQDRVPTALRVFISTKLSTLAYFAAKQYFKDNSKILDAISFNYVSQVSSCLHTLGNNPHFILLTEKSNQEALIIQEKSKQIKLEIRSIPLEESSPFHCLVDSYPDVRDALLLQRDQIFRASEDHFERNPTPTSAALDSYIHARRDNIEADLPPNSSKLDQQFNQALIINEIFSQSQFCALGRSAEVLFGEMGGFDDPRKLFHHFQFRNIHWTKNSKQQYVYNVAFKRNVSKEVTDKNIHDDFPAIKDKMIKDVVQNQTENESVVKCKPFQKGALVRALGQMRAKNETRVLATVEFIKTHLNLLSDPDIQQSCLDNLLQWPAFYHETQQNPHFLNELIEYVNKELRAQCQAGALTGPGPFMLKLRTQILYFLQSSTKKNAYELMEYLNRSDKNIDKLTEKYQKMKNLSYDNQLKLLQLCQAQIYSKSISIAQQGNKVALETLSDFFNLLLLYQNKLEISPFYKRIITHAIFTVGVAIKKLMDNGVLKTEDLVKIMDPLLAKHGVTLSGPKVIDFPYYIVGETVINLQTMVIHEGGKNREELLPDAITQHPDFESYFGKNRKLAGRISDDLSLSLFKDHDKSYEFRMIDSANASLQTEIDFLGVKKKYTYFKLFGNDKFRRLKILPHTLLERSLEHWINTKDNELLIMQDNKPLYYANLNTKEIYLIVDGAKSSYQLIPDSRIKDLHPQLHARFANFESLKYIEMFQSSDNPDDILIKLPRYNLSFKLVAGKWVWCENPDYALDLAPKGGLPVDDLNAIFHLTTRVKGKEPHIVLLPKQRFLDAFSSNDIGTKTLESEYRKLSVDTTNRIYEKNCLKASKGSIKEMRLIFQPTSHQYRGREEYLSYGVSQENFLKAQTSQEYADAAYLYMGLRHHELAYDALAKTSSQSSPTYSLIESLRRIIADVPDQNADEAEKLTSTSASATAVRLLALSMCILYKTRYPDALSKPKHVSDTNNFSDIVRNYRDNITFDYYEEGSLARQFIQFYRHYLTIKNNIPIEKRINEKIEFQLLQFCKKHIEFDAFPQIDYRYRQGELSYLLQLKRDLGSDISGFTPSQLLQMEHIESEIKKNHSKTFHQQRLQVDGQNIERVSVAVDYPIIPTRIPKEVKPLNIDSVEGEKMLAEFPTPTSILGPFFEKELQKIKADVSTLPKSLSLSGAGHIKNLGAELVDDFEQGKRDIAKDMAQNQYFIDYFTKRLTSVPQVKAMDRYFLENMSDAQKKMDGLFLQIMTLLNQPPVNDQAALEWEMAHMGRSRKPLTFAEAIDLFLQNDITYTLEKTNLNAQQCRILHNQIYQYLLLSTHKQQCQRIHASLEKLKNPKMNKVAREQEFVQLGKSFVQKRCYDPSKHLDFLVFEHLDDKLLFKKQFDYLSKLTSDKADPYQVLQLIMGGGKSKVLIPLLAQRFANGKNLSLVIVPQALLNTNYEDLAQTSGKLFGKNVHKLSFSRDTLCTKESLSNIEKMLQLAIQEREYLITTPESLQSLELKFLELMQIPPKDDPFIQEKIAIMTRILNTIKYLSVPIVDEVDKALAVKRLLNYTVGPGVSVKPHLSKATFQLYEFMKNVTLPSKASLYDFIAGKAPALSKKEWPEVIQQLAHLLVFEQSPIESICAALNDFEKKVLLNYLTEKNTEIPKFFSSLNNEEKDILALYKEQICRYLPVTLLKTYNFHYGLSHNAKTLQTESEIAIPYDGAGMPNERARFSNYITALNYTIQMHIQKPLSESMLLHFIRDFGEKIAKNDLLGAARTNEDRVLFETIADIPFDEIGELDFSINPGLRKLINNMKLNPKIREYCVSHFVLPCITHNPKVLSSNAQAFVSMFEQRFIGLSGTDWNYHTYHPKIICQKEVSKGTDGQTLCHLLRKDYELFEQTDSSSLDESVDSALSANKNKAKIHAMIDLGAIGSSVSNEQFAELNALKKNLSSIKYILFFNTDNQLCALPLQGVKLTPIMIGISDKAHIQKVLSEASGEPITSKDWFTLYDQAHTVGIDITQADDAHGLLTIEKQTTLRDLLQAVMRMRGLAQGQQIDYFIPDEVRRFYPGRVWTPATVIEMALNNQLQKLSEDIFASAFHKMDDLLRQVIMDKILLTQDYSLQVSIMRECEDILYHIDDRSCFEQYGSIDTEQAVIDILRKKKAQILKRFDELQAKNILPEGAKVQISKNLNTIIKKTLPYVPGKMYANAEQFTQHGMVSETQKETQKETEKEKEMETEQLSSDAGLQPLVAKEWTLRRDALNSFDLRSIKKNAGVEIASLFSLTKDLSKRKILFSPDIYVSENFARTFEGQSDFLGLYQKNAIFILNIFNDKTKSCQMMMMTCEEAEYFRNQMSHKEFRNPNLWIETASGATFAGHAPDLAKTSKAYLNQKQQINYLTGNLDQVYEGLDKADWIKSHSIEKLKYYEENILPLHQDKPKLLSQLDHQIKITSEVSPQRPTMLVVGPRISMHDGLRVFSSSVSVVPSPAEGLSPPSPAESLSPPSPSEGLSPSSPASTLSSPNDLRSLSLRSFNVGANQAALLKIKQEISERFTGIQSVGSKYRMPEVIPVFKELLKIGQRISEPNEVQARRILEELQAFAARQNISKTSKDLSDILNKIAQIKIEPITSKGFKK